jgi:pimeloyl-ACP methyl ester carboxylesterase
MSDDRTDDPHDDVVLVDYDEFGLFHENIAEYDLEVAEAPPVERIETVLDDGRAVSALRWGSSPPEIVLVHGGAQNAHTWDTVVLALGRPALAVDLPGHGHSDWRDDGEYSPRLLADDVAVAVRTHAPNARLVVGMSLGGLTAMELAVRHPDLVRRLVMVDITPGTNREKTKAILDFVNGPQSFPSFEDLLARTIEHNPTRSVSSLRRGILHNARQLPDGSWRWRYDRSTHRRASGTGASDDGAATGASETGAVEDVAAALSPLWDDFGSVRCPFSLLRGSLSPVVDDDDIAEARRRLPDLDVRTVEGAGHSIQGDRPVELAAILAELLDA